MRKAWVLILTILCIAMVSCQKDINKDNVDVISGTGYDGNKKIIEEFNND